MFSYILLFFRARTSITTRLLVRSLRLILTVILIILLLDKSFTASSTNRVRTHARTLICGIQADKSLLAAFERNPCAQARSSCYLKAQALTIHNSNSSIRKLSNSNSLFIISTASGYYRDHHWPLTTLDNRRNTIDISGGVTARAVGSATIVEDPDLGHVISLSGSEAWIRVGDFESK